MMESEPAIIWRPGKDELEYSGIVKFMHWLRKEHQLSFDSPDTLWEWSVDSHEQFWEILFQYFEIMDHGKYTSVTNGKQMPETRWFQGTQVNYAEHIFRNKTDERPAIIHKTEIRDTAEISWQTLEQQVASLAYYLKQKGVGKGDRVVAFTANIPETSIAFLAVNSLGAIWSSCSPDFGVDSVLERFQQIEPKILFAVNGYTYNGKPYDKVDIVEEVYNNISTLEEMIVIDLIEECRDFSEEYTPWAKVVSRKGVKLEFTPVAFNDPIWVLYSSGTTGNPKAITHSHGGMLLEHMKYMTFHNDVREGERFFWFSTTGWMMWNFVHSALLVGGTIVLYDGSASYPNLSEMWRFSEEVGMHHFGTSAPFLVACMKRKMTPNEQYNLSTLRSIGSTGSPLPPEAYSYVREHVKENLWLCSMSGGTDVCTAFVGGHPLLPVYQGEIQSRSLGCALYAYDTEGNRIVGNVGEMVIEKSMPCMPIYFWGDENNERYLSSYFDNYVGKWRHGDWIKITERNSLIILGRSDATLNRQGIRIGTAEIYRSIQQIDEIEDSLIVNLELNGGNHYMPLFVKMKESNTLETEMINRIKKMLRLHYTPRHVPDDIIEVPDIPYTISGKKMEAPIKKVLMRIPSKEVMNKDAMKNPDCVQFYIDFATTIEDRI